MRKLIEATFVTLDVDGACYFTAGPGTRKAKNLARDPRCVITVATFEFDLVIEGEATKVTDEARLQHIADAYAAEGWQPTVRDGALYAEYSAPSAGRRRGKSTKSTPQPSSPWARPNRTAPRAGAFRGRQNREILDCA